jgi:TIR domain
MAFDTFISYSSKHKTAADAVCAVLEHTGIRCWIAPRDIRPGGEYGGAIVEAIDQCRVMVLIFSSSANNSRQIHREIERAVSKGVPIIPVRIEEVIPTKSMEYFLGAIHWLDALTPPLENHLQPLAETVKALLQVDATVPSTPPQDNGRQAVAWERIRPAGSAVRAHGGFASLVAARRLLIPVIGVGCIALLMGGIWLYQMRGPIPRSAPDPSSLQPAQGRAEAPVSHTPVKEVFEKHKLLGIFASDCGKPASKSNLYYVSRLLDGDRVQREVMSGPTNRDFVIVIDKGSEVKPNEVLVSGTREGKPQEILWRIERNADGIRMRGLEASWDGKKLISGGKVTDSGRETAWLNRCGDER